MVKKISSGGEKLVIDRNRRWDNSHAREKGGGGGRTENEIK